MSYTVDTVRSWFTRLPAFLPGVTGSDDGHHTRVRTPTVLQMEAVECGAAALATILAYHGRHVPLETLRTECGVSRDGSKASNVIKAARGYGMEAAGYKRQPDDLRTMEPPMIVHWNFNHFVVFEGFRNGKAYLNDPAVGPRTVSLQEFDESFTGVALTFTPGPDFEPGGETYSLISALRQRLQGSGTALLFIMLAGLIMVVPGLLEPTFQKVFVDNALIRGLDDWVLPILLFMGGTTLFYGTLLWVRQSHLLRLEMKLALSSSSQFFWHVLRLPIVFFTQRSSGDISTRVGLNDRIAKLLSGKLATNALNIIVIVFYALLMVQYDVWLTLIVVVITALNIAALQYVSRRRTDLNQRLQQERGKMMGAAMGGLQSIETLKATGAESDFFTRWAGHHAKVVNAEQKLGLYTQMLSIVPPFLMAISVALVLGIGGLRIMDGALTIGMLIGFQVLMGNFIAPVNEMVTLGSTLQEVEGDMKRLDDVEQHDIDPALNGSPTKKNELVAEHSHSTGDAIVPEPQSKPDTPDEVQLAGFLSLRDVTFGYNPLGDPLIDGFSLDVNPGSRVALVGGSGSGKSTIAKLVCGLYEPWDGDVLFDGAPRTEIDRNVMTNSFAVVDQQIFLFGDTIRNNLSLWDPTLPEEHVVQAARDACIHQEITARPKGYDEMLAEDGQNFSGGQRQRLELARALASNPSILVLDEATSALDPSTEKRIDDNLRRRGCTCLIIAHRLSTIRDCDEIIVLDRGSVVQRGRHETLVEMDGPYVDLLDSM